jgi:Lrp/AsnC family leucine-responsive transcriptional regulator
MPAHDRIDLAILQLLQGDARLANAEIARQVGLAPSAVYERIRKLEEAGVITGYHANLAAKTFDLGLLAFVSVRTSERPHEVTAAQRMSELPEVLEVHHIAGEDCYLLKVRTTDAEALGRFLRHRLGVIPNVVTTRTTIVFATLKETAALPLPPPETPETEAAFARKEKRRG